jgi:CRISPR-associated protein Cas1
MITFASWPELEGVAWHTVRVELRNLRNTFARQPPQAIFWGLLKSAAHAGDLSDNDEFFFHPLQPLASRMHKGEIYALELVFPVGGPEVLVGYLERLRQHTADQRHNFELVRTGAPRHRTVADVARDGGWLDFGGDEVCLDFLTALPWQSRDKERWWLLAAQDLARLLAGRIQKLYGLAPPAPEALALDVRILPYFWERLHLPHPSRSVGGTQPLGGLVGPLYLRGALSRWLPLLLACSELHAGPRIGTGQGYYRLLMHRPFFDTALKQAHWYEATSRALAVHAADRRPAREIEHLLHAADPEALRTTITAGTWQPGMAHAFPVPKRHGGQRLIATLADTDRFIHKLLQLVLSGPLDRMFEHGSIGYRRGKSRDLARGFVAAACREGYTHALEVDIASFFDSVDWSLMEQKLDNSFPRGDPQIRKLLAALLRTPVMLQKQGLPRDRGLLQGSPLSPLLSNLYLDSLDEAMERRGHRMIRFADDILVLTRSPEAAAVALRDLREILGTLHIELGAEKTSLESLDTGFRFLGLQLGFGVSEEALEATALRKTAFIRQPYAFLGLDGDALTVRREGLLLARLPLTRLGNLIVVGPCAVSTPLLQRCSREEIPVTFCSITGHYLNTLRPESRRYYEIAGRHHDRHRDLTAAQKTQLAGQLVAAKIQGYLRWFREYPAADLAALCHELDQHAQHALGAESLEAVRGYEGAAARQAFQFWVGRIKHPDFASPGREPHNKKDRLNALLDFAYSLLFSRLNILVRSAGLNPYLGVLHSDHDNYESLVCDLQEPFRCRMDRLVLKAINREELRADDFEPLAKGTGLRLNSAAMGGFAEAFEQELAVRLTYETAALEQLLLAQVYAVLAWVQGHTGLCFIATQG